jgi:hypothetical protein
MIKTEWYILTTSVVAMKPDVENVKQFGSSALLFLIPDHSFSHPFLSQVESRREGSDLQQRW